MSCYYFHQTGGVRLSRANYGCPVNFTNNAGEEVAGFTMSSAVQNGETGNMRYRTANRDTTPLFNLGIRR